MLSLEINSSTTNPSSGRQTPFIAFPATCLQFTLNATKIPGERVLCFGSVSICSYNPPLSLAKQFKRPRAFTEPPTACARGCSERQRHTPAASFGSRHELLRGGSSADKPGNEGQGEGASGSRAPSVFPSYYTYKVDSAHHQASQNVLPPLQIKLSTCATEINYRHQAGSSQTLTGLE